MSSLFALLLVACATPGQDTALPEVSCPADSIAAPGFHASLQAVLDTAEDGAVLCVAPGTWGPVRIDRPVTLIGGAGPLHTELHGRHDGSAVWIADAGAVALHGLSITGGKATLGGGLRAEGKSHVTLVDVLVSGNDAERGGGVAVLDGAFLESEDTVVVLNQADGAGGVWVQDAAIDLAGVSLLSNQPDDLGCSRSYGCD